MSANDGDATMRFMIVVLATQEADEAGRLPTAEELAAMGRYQEAMVKAGFSLIRVRSKAEAIEWASRAPFPAGTRLEIRQVFEDDDFAPERSDG